MTTRKKGYKIIVMVFVLLACTMLVAFKSQETGILIQDKNASTIFWELNDRIKKDRNNPGVIIEMSRSLLVENLISLIKHNVITLDELNDFSEETKESIQMWLNL